MTVTVTLRVPPSVYQLAQRTAKATARPVEEVLAGVLAAAAPTSENLPPDIRVEIDALAELDDGTLWKIARRVFPATRRRRYDELLDKNGAGTIAPDEREELKNLRLESERLMLRKAHAYALLRWRGHVLPRLADLPRPR